MHLCEGKFSCLASYYLTGSYRKLCRPVKDAPPGGGAGVSIIKEEREGRAFCFCFLPPATKVYGVRARGVRSTPGIQGGAPVKFKGC